MAKSSFLRTDIAIETICGTLFPKQKPTGQSDVHFLYQALSTTHRSILRGTAKADRLTGGSTHNRIYGKAGNDRLNGKAGRDRLYGGNGNDILEGSIHDDHLWGGKGRDIFVLQLGQGVDQVHDFNPAMDRLHIKGGLSFRELRFEVQGNQTQIFSTSKFLVDREGKS